MKKGNGEDLGKVFMERARDEEHGCFLTKALLEGEMLNLDDGMMEIYATD